MSSRNNPRQSATPSSYQTIMVEFNVCRTKRDREKCKPIAISPYNTIKQLKEKISESLRITVPTKNFFLEQFIENKRQWVKINDSNASATINELKLKPGSILSIDYRDQALTEEDSLIRLILSSSANSELLLKLCKKPMDRTDFVELRIRSSSTIAELRKHAYNSLYKVSKNRPIYLWSKDNWMKFDSSMDDLTLADKPFESYAFISIEQDKENINRELLLKLCKKPMERTDSVELRIRSSSTVAELRKQAYEKLYKSSKNRHIYLWNKDNWMKFDSSMDDLTLADKPFESHAFISIDYDEETFNSKSPSGLCGLANLGSTCYMNSVFQCFSNISEFTRKILALNDEVNAPITAEYAKLIKKMWSGKHSSIEPERLLDNINENLPHYSNYRQQDAQEFMNHFLHLIHAEFSTKDTIITELFYGQIRSTVKCLTCNQIESTNESISFLPLPISNYNQKNVLYLKTDGEQRQIAIQIHSSVRSVGDLIDCFLDQYDLKVNKDQIIPIELVNNIFNKKHYTWTYLDSIREEELAFLELPKKSHNQAHILCEFHDSSTDKQFRPPVHLVCPISGCRYSDLSDQIEQLLGHLCSTTDTPVSVCRVYWVNRSGQMSKLSIETDIEESLPRLETIIIRMETGAVAIYKLIHNTNNSSSNSGLTSLLADFFREEPLDGDYHCLKCAKHTKARQKSDLCLPLPQVLVIQLKRFTYDVYSNNKIDTYISFPVHELDLNEYIVKDNSNQNGNNLSTKYDLVAVSNHTGSLTCGHYTTYAKNVQDGKWYLFDDRFVRKLYDDHDIVTKDAYILIYVQKT